MVRLGLLILALLLGRGAAAEEPAKVAMAVVPSVPSAATFIALDKGYFRDAGIDVAIERIDSQSKVIPFLATGRIQVAQGGLSAGFFNAVAEGLPITIAFESGSSPIFHKILVRNELAGKLKTVADLRGLRLAVSAPGSTAVYEVGKTLESAGLGLKDVDLKYVAFPLMGAALGNGAIDAALEVAPFTDLVVEQKLAVAWIDPEDYIRPLPLGAVAYMANAEWLAKDRDAARRFFLAVARGTRDYCEAYHRGPNRGEVLDIMVRHKVSTDRALLDRMDWQARDPDGRYSMASLIDIEDWFLRQGIIAKKAPPERLLDPSFAEAAAKALGPFVLANTQSTKSGCGR